jgi:hypothetical protein
MTTHEIAVAKRQYRECVEALLTAEELARFDAYHGRVEASLHTHETDPVMPTAEEQAALTKLAEDTQAAALRKRLDVLLRIDTLPQ